MLAVLMFLALLVLGGRLIKYFGIAAQGGMDVAVLFKLVGYQLPYLMEYLLPLSFFIALMLVLGRLYVDHEMSIIKTAGVSPRRVGLMLLPLVLIMVLLQAGLSLWAKPWGLYSAEKLKTEQAIRSAFDLIQPGEFITANEYSLYVGALSPDKRELLDVMLIEREGFNTDTSGSEVKPKDTIIIAKRAAQVSEAEVATQKALRQKAQAEQSTDEKMGEPNITMLDLYNGRRYQLGENNLAYNQVAFSHYRITLESPNKKAQDNLEIEAQSTLSLFNKLPDRTALAELGYRIALPFVMIIALMLAIPLSKVNPRQGRWLKLLPSILLFATSVVAIMSLKGSVAKEKVGVWVYLVVLLLYALFAVYVYNKNKVHRRVKDVVTDVTQSRGQS